MFHGWDENLADKIRSNSYLRKFFKAIYRDADVLVVLCNFYKKRLIELGLLPERIEVLSTMYQKVDEISQDRLPVTRNEKINLLFLSRFVESKGLYIAAQVGKLLIENGYKNFKLIFAGDGPENEGLMNYIKRYGLEDYLELKGFVTGDKKQAILQSSDIFLFPTYSEGCPIAFLEAMGAGLAIVSTPVGAIPEIVEHNLNGFIIDSKDPQDFYKAVRKLIGDQELLERMQKLNREKAEQNYEAKLVTQKVESLYLSVIYG